MKLRNLITGAALALMIVATALAQEKPANGPASGSPKFVIASMSHDFGEVKPGTPLKYSFTFKNHGKADLLIHSVTPG